MSKNFAISAVAVAPSPASSGLSLTVTTGTGGRFIAGLASIYPTGTVPDPTNAEVVTISGIAGDVLTITRASESSTPRTVLVGDVIVQGITAGMWDAARIGSVTVTGTPTAGQVPVASSGSAAAWGAPGGSADKLGLTPTAVKTGAYTAAAGDLVPVDTTSGNVTITLPTAPADGSVIAVKHVTQGGSNVVNLALGGSDVFNKTGGPTTGSLTLLNQAVLMQYKATGAIWYVIADDIPLAALTATFSPLSEVARATAAEAALANGTNLYLAATYR